MYLNYFIFYKHFFLNLHILAQGVSFEAEIIISVSGILTRYNLKVKKTLISVIPHILSHLHQLLYVIDNKLLFHNYLIF